MYLNVFEWMFDGLFRFTCCICFVAAEEAGAGAAGADQAAALYSDVGCHRPCGAGAGLAGAEIAIMISS